MELNPDCMRDVLGLIAKNPMGSFIDKIPNELKEKYSDDDLIYTLKMIDEAKLAHINFYYGSNRLAAFSISQMTPKGQELYSKIKPRTIWEKTKNAIKNIGAPFTVNLIKEVATKELLASI